MNVLNATRDNIHLVGLLPAGAWQRNLGASSLGLAGMSRASSRKEQSGADLIESAREVVAHVRGDQSAVARRAVVFMGEEIRAIRERQGLSQAEFARAYMINVRALQDWEQGRRVPETAVQATCS